MQYEIVRAIDNSDNGTRATGLTPVVVYAKTLAAGTDVSAHVAISAIASGDYLVAYDAILYGDAAIQVDLTVTLPLAADRYKSIVIRGTDPAAALLDAADGVETDVTLRQALRIIAAILAGKVSGAGSGVETFVGLDGDTPRVEVATDAAGNRLSVTFDPA